MFCFCVSVCLSMLIVIARGRISCIHYLVRWNCKTSVLCAKDALSKRYTVKYMYAYDDCICIRGVSSPIENTQIMSFSHVISQ